jgi:hypothetical protein
MAVRAYWRCQLLANATIATARVGSSMRRAFGVAVVAARPHPGWSFGAHWH